MNTIKLQHRRLLRAIYKKDQAIKDLHNSLRESVTFEFTIEDIPGDGLCILNVDTDRLVSLNKCLNLIQNHVLLTEAAHAINSI